MAAYDYDLVTIGAGSGGVRASRLTAQTGARVAVVENSRVGGTCVIRGCIPKKLLAYAAHFQDDFEDAFWFGWEKAQPAFDWSRLIANKDREIDRLNGIYIKLLRDSGVTIVEGTARLVDPHTVEVDGRRLTAKHILIAAGAWPEIPTVPWIERAITSNEAFDLKTQPKRVVIVGGGYIAVEFAGIFRGLGSAVSLVIRADSPLRGFDEDIRAGLADEMTKRGIAIKAKSQVRSIEAATQGVTVRLDTGETIAADQILYATGRKPRTQGLGLEAAGIKLDPVGAVVVDSYSRTAVESIYAIGDVTNRLNLTPVALAEGMAFVATVFGGLPTAFDYANVPTAVFSHPQISCVGLTEAQAKASHGAIDVYVARFKPLKHTLSCRDELTLMKLIVDRATDRVLGCHMMGMDAAEIVQGLAVAITAGATKRDFDRTIGIHPTAAEEFVTMRTKRPDPVAPTPAAPAKV